MQQYFIEKASTYDEAERKAREKYGERLTILMHENVKIPRGPFKLFSQDGVQITGIIPRGRPAPVAEKPATVAEKPAMTSSSSSKMTLDFAAEKEKLLAMANTGKENSTLKEVLKLCESQLAEVRTIKEKLEEQSFANSQVDLSAEHPTLSRLDSVLTLNDFSVSCRKVLLERARKEFSLDGLLDYDAVQDKALQWIGEGIKIYNSGEFNGKFKVRPKIVVLVGPTGVGKTTTVAKLAANFGIDDKGRHKRNVSLITIDSYRIGAKQQLEVYGGVMEFPCFSATDYDDLKKIIAVNSDNTDLFLVDTIGKSPRDMARLGEMKLLLDALGTLAEVHLVVAATTKPSDVEEILKTFEPFNYKSVIVTKMDETLRIGNIIGALSERAKPVSYITNGQKVPTDIRKASVIQFLVNLEGFKVNRIKLEGKFPDRGNELIQQWR